MSRDYNIEPGLLGSIVMGLIVYYLTAYTPLGHAASLIAPFLGGIVAGIAAGTPRRGLAAGLASGLLAPLLLIAVRLLTVGTNALAITRTGILWIIPYIHVIIVFALAASGAALVYPRSRRGEA